MEIDLEKGAGLMQSAMKVKTLTAFVSCVDFLTKLFKKTKENGIGCGKFARMAFEFVVASSIFGVTHSFHHITAWKVSKYGVIYGLYFPLFGLNTGKYGPEITPDLDTFHAVEKM